MTFTGSQIAWTTTLKDTCSQAAHCRWLVGFTKTYISYCQPEVQFLGEWGFMWAIILLAELWTQRMSLPNSKRMLRVQRRDLVCECFEMLVMGSYVRGRYFRSIVWDHFTFNQGRELHVDFLVY